jgi:hypothetical protein
VVPDRRVVDPVEETSYLALKKADRSNQAADGRPGRGC